MRFSKAAGIAGNGCHEDRHTVGGLEPIYQAHRGDGFGSDVPTEGLAYTGGGPERSGRRSGKLIWRIGASCFV